MLSNEERAKTYGKVVAKAWADESFKKKLMSDPNKVLKENGIDVPKNIEIRVVENTENVMYLTLPTKPSQELPEADLDNVAGGVITRP